MGDELCVWENAQATWDMAMFGLRIGQHPRWLFTSTPKPIKLLRELLAREGKDLVITRGSTFENAANLAPAFLEAIKARYAGTRLGRQELEAELLSDTPGALWQLDWLDRDRVARAPELKRIVVAIDPAVSTNEGSGETGIIVAGIDVDSFRWPCYFADCGLKRHPMGMGGRRGRRIRVRAKLECEARISSCRSW